MTRRVVSDQGLTHARWIQPGYMVPETVVAEISGGGTRPVVP